ncbi:metalloregulator ArsR/SmtB family transcription factor [Neorhizobium sp. JUb45]|uniref:ArsR/SmtB family transcription factor n=1 Tax=Neorhizobium sp. JUb45 TaxID=2485113 RepID=UPI0010453608|nr:metalloregulator ArsR/SmtB family transcription factor [Neorhizobium sp. JUb45]
MHLKDRDKTFHDKSAELLSHLANCNRLDILRLLLDTEISVGDLSRKIGLSQSALSQHLARLRSSGLVETRRDAQTIYYTTRHDGVRKLLQCLEEITSDGLQEKLAR